MIENIYNLLMAQANNQMMIAGIVTVLTGSIMYLLKNIPLAVYNAIMKRITYSVIIYNDESTYIKFVKHIENGRIDFLSRSSSVARSEVVTGEGTNYAWFGGKFIKVRSEILETNGSDIRKRLTITFFFTGYKKIKDIIVNLITTKEDDSEQRTDVWTNEGGFLRYSGHPLKRERESIYIKNAILEKLEKRLNFFKNNEDYYAKNGIPYKHSVLLHGLPGTGKTSIAKYIASYTNSDIVVTDLASLNKLRLHSNNTYMIIVEDIDRCTITNEGHQSDAKNNEISMATILNFIDGIATPNNVIFVFTTNHIEKLDPAFIRKGRMDDIIEIPPLDSEDIKDALTRIFGENDYSELNSNLNLIGAIVQDCILSNIDNGYEKIIEDLNSYSEPTLKVVSDNTL